MKRKHIWLIGISVFLLLSSLVIYNNTDKTSDKEFLYTAGFKNIPTFNSYEKDDNRKFWKEEYDLNYLSYKEAEDIMKVQNFIIAPCENYTGDINPRNQRMIHYNYKKIKDDLLTYRINPANDKNSYYYSHNEVGYWIRGNETDNADNYRNVDPDIYQLIDKKALLASNMPHVNKWNMLRDDTYTKIQIISNAHNFMPSLQDSAHMAGKIINTSMAVIPHREGYVILCSWK